MLQVAFDSELSIALRILPQPSGWPKRLPTSSSLTLEPLPVSSQIPLLPSHGAKGRLFLVIIITLLAKTPRSEMHPAKYVFGSDGMHNNTGGWNDGLAFLFGLLSVQWTVSVPLQSSLKPWRSICLSTDDGLRRNCPHH